MAQAMRALQLTWEPMATAEGAATTQAAQAAARPRVGLRVQWLAGPGAPARTARLRSAQLRSLGLVDVPAQHVALEDAALLLSATAGEAAAAGAVEAALMAAAARDGGLTEAAAAADTSPEAAVEAGRACAAAARAVLDALALDG
eukprot:1983828-Pleurochrysis_carterae.AAC.1